MTRDDIIETALQCGVWIPMAQGQEREQTIDRLQRFVGRAVEAEREACAITARAVGMDLHQKQFDAREVGASCASAIRARGDA